MTRLPECQYPFLYHRVNRKIYRVNREISGFIKMSNRTGLYTDNL